MMIDYKQISIISSVVWFVLFLVLLIFPNIIYWLFKIPQSEIASFVLRRASLLFLGLSAVSWISKESPNSDARQAICAGFAISMLALAILGSIEFFRGIAGIGIWVAILVEIGIGVSYFRIWLKHRRLNQTADS